MPRSWSIDYSILSLIAYRNGLRDELHIRLVQIPTLYISGSNWFVRDIFSPTGIPSRDMLHPCITTLEMPLLP